MTSPNSSPQSSVRITETITCQGVTTRTTNEQEMNPETAKIASLWQTFQSTFCDIMDENTQVYGVYHNYESDMNGEYEVTACIANLSPARSDETLTEVAIEAGEYLVFRKQGEMPQAVIDAWGEVWMYFNREDCPHTRRYDIDFEKYVGMDTVEVYIGILQ